MNAFRDKMMAIKRRVATAKARKEAQEKAKQVATETEHRVCLSGVLEAFKSALKDKDFAKYFEQHRDSRKLGWSERFSLAYLECGETAALRLVITGLVVGNPADPSKLEVDLDLKNYKDDYPRRVFISEIRGRPKALLLKMIKRLSTEEGIKDYFLERWPPKGA
jgi:hypothetical protein